MGKYSNSSRSFNTLKHSNRTERSKRKSTSKRLILLICAVIVAIVLTLAVFFVVALVDKANSKLPKNEKEVEIALAESTLPSADAAKGDLILVNRLHRYQFAEEADLVSASTAAKKDFVKDGSILVNKDALAAFDLMMEAYERAVGESDVWLVEAYRTEAQQVGKEFPAGYSDHHTGRLLTITEKGTKVLSSGNWLYENCYQYGFVVRYPNEKSAATGANKGYDYAFRYVGVPHATYMQKNNLCMEEYIIRLQDDYSNGQMLRFKAADGNQYAVYAVKAASEANTSLSLPSALSYTVSGDNAGYFIITVNLGKAE